MASTSEAVPSKTTRTGGKRIRTSKACDACRSRKVKCDGLEPCTRCGAATLECIYKGEQRRRGPDKVPGTRHRRTKAQKQHDDMVALGLIPADATRPTSRRLHSSTSDTPEHDASTASEQAPLPRDETDAAGEQKTKENNTRKRRRRSSSVSSTSDASESSRSRAGSGARRSPTPTPDNRTDDSPSTAVEPSIFPSLPSSEQLPNKSLITQADTTSPPFESPVPAVFNEPIIPSSQPPPKPKSQLQSVSSTLARRNSAHVQPSVPSAPVVHEEPLDSLDSEPPLRIARQSTENWWHRTTTEFVPSQAQQVQVQSQRSRTASVPVASSHVLPSLAEATVHVPSPPPPPLFAPRPVPFYPRNGIEIITAEPIRPSIPSSYRRAVDMPIYEKNYSPSIAQEPSLEYWRSSWWDALLDAYSTSERDLGIQEMISDFRALFRHANVLLSFLHVPSFLSKLARPETRMKLQPSLVLSVLALSSLMQSSGSRQGYKRRRAVLLHGWAQGALDAAINVQSIDPSLAQAALVIALYEISPHEFQTRERNAAALLKLDSILLGLGLPSMDRDHPLVSSFSSHSAPVVDARADPAPAPSYPTPHPGSNGCYEPDAISLHGQHVPFPIDRHQQSHQHSAPYTTSSAFPEHSHREPNYHYAPSSHHPPSHLPHGQSLQHSHSHSLSQPVPRSHSHSHMQQPAPTYNYSYAPVLPRNAFHPLPEHFGYPSNQDYASVDSETDESLRYVYDYSHVLSSSTGAGSVYNLPSTSNSSFGRGSNSSIPSSGHPSASGPAMFNDPYSSIINPTNNSISTSNPNLPPATSQGSYRPTQIRCACDALSLAKNPMSIAGLSSSADAPHDSRLSVGFTSSPSWHPDWTEAEIEREQNRQVVWSALWLTSSHASHQAAFNLPRTRFASANPANFAVLFPGEELHLDYGYSMSGKESVWALYSRSLLLWNACLEAHDNVIDATNRDQAAAFAMQVWLEVDRITKLLDRHTCSIEASLHWAGRSFLQFARMSVTYNYSRFVPSVQTGEWVPQRRETEEWAEHMAFFIKTSKGPEQFRRLIAEMPWNPFMVWMFSDQYSRCLNLWEQDHSHLMCLEVARQIAPALDNIVGLFAPVPYFDEYRRDLNKRLAVALQEMNMLPIQPEPPHSHTGEPSLFVAGSIRPQHEVYLGHDYSRGAP